MASITTLVTPSPDNQSDIASSDRVIVLNVRTSCIRRPAAPTGHPDAAHHLGLPDIQRRDPRDDLLLVLRDFHPAHLHSTNRQVCRPGSLVDGRRLGGGVDGHRDAGRGSAFPATSVQGSATSEVLRRLTLCQRLGGELTPRTW